ncbi:CheR family methyltransferase [Oceanobacillus halotolerans]|uniref:CheR family methyltransferase n=1 Tax=Oceanobacillus halotolerans TaxID=2663380 RepID=UPI0013DC329E|nr:protein-glutamate O-methyltransferase CheR [Oceanobacillus halotolerans]
MSEEYKQFINRIYQKLGIDLKLYKEAQMKRRLTSLRNKRGYTNFHDYFKALEKDNQLLAEFMDRITINVSEFYRNPKRWEVLQTVTFPELTKDKNDITIWSAACSTGEEPYSLAIMLREYFPAIKFSILATDIDENVLKRAKQGIYQEQALKALPDNMKHKYFDQKNGIYYIDQQIKKYITFKKHNLLSDTYPKNNDLIVCRNVLIYFTDTAKDTIYHHFNKALNQNGVLFVGSTEQIFNPSNYGFSLLDTFYYQKK